MTPALRFLLAALGAFLAGSIPFGVLFARARGVDLRKVGSGNIGATNAARALGKRIGMLVFLCDAAKGLAPVLLARAAGPSFLPSAFAVWLPAACGAAAFLGHLAPPWLRFRGGKGVATAFGVFVAVAPLPALVALLLFGAVYSATHLSSLGSLIAATAFPPALWLLGGDRQALVLSGFTWALILWKHRENVARLVRGEEDRL